MLTESGDFLYLSMKWLVVITILFASATLYAQDEFASNGFYSAVKKIQTERQNGFEQLKGRPLQSDYPELKKEYRAKVLLPLADSGRIIEPVEGQPYAIYFFEPEKKRDKIETRAASLRDGLVKSQDSPLYSRTTSTTRGKEVFTDTYFFTDPEETHVSKALFRISVYMQDKKYHLAAEIR